MNNSLKDVAKLNILKLCTYGFHLQKNASFCFEQIILLWNYVTIKKVSFAWLYIIGIIREE